MKTRAIWLLPIVGLVSEGCIFQSTEVAVQPFVLEAQAADVPEVEGFWVGDAEEQGEHPTTLDFRRAEGATWELVVGELGRDGGEVFRVRFGRIGDRLVWDLSPQPAAADGLRGEHQLTLHSLARVSLEGDRMGVAFLNSEGIGKQLERGELDLAHVTTEDERRVLIAPNGELRAFVERQDDAAFDERVSVFLRARRP